MRELCPGSVHDRLVVLSDMISKTDYTILQVKIDRLLKEFEAGNK
jgi:hypothetical protein